MTPAAVWREGWGRAVWAEAALVIQVSEPNSRDLEETDLATDHMGVRMQGRRSK